MLSNPRRSKLAHEAWTSEGFPRRLRESLDKQRWFALLAADLRDEVVQDTLEVLLQRMGKRIKDPLAYAVRTARNRSRLLLARASKYQPISEGGLISADESPENAAAAEESGRRLEDAVRRLPHRQQQVVRLVLEKGMRVDNVAQALKISRESVYQHLSRAIRKLRDEIT